MAKGSSAAAREEQIKAKRSAIRVLLERKDITTGDALLEPASTRERRLLDANEVLVATGSQTAALMTLASILIARAQARGEACAMITDSTRLPHAPDLVAAGVDLPSLPFLRVADAVDAAHAVKTLLSSGAFGLIVWDMAHPQKLTQSAVATLSLLADAQGTSLLLLAQGRDAIERGMSGWRCERVLLTTEAISCGEVVLRAWRMPHRQLAGTWSCVGQRVEAPNHS